MGYLDRDGLTHLWRTIKTALSGKQDTLTGTQGQVVGFDVDGIAVAQEAPSGGMAQAEADGRYLRLSGGSMSGNLDLLAGTSLRFYYRNPMIWPPKDEIKTLKIKSSFQIQPTVATTTYCLGCDCAVQFGEEVSLANHILRCIASPVYDTDGANKKYVDDAAASAFPVGGIVIWSGASDAVPDGWVLCNGENGTPDLRDKALTYIMKL